MPVQKPEQLFNHSGWQTQLNEKRLVGARCTNCGELFVPPRSLCTHCYGTQLEWQTLSGQGWLEGFTIIHVGLPAMAADGYDRQHPYCSGVVRLAEGPAISGQIIGVDCSQPEHIQVGMPVRAVFIERGSGKEMQTYLAFAPKEAR